MTAQRIPAIVLLTAGTRAFYHSRVIKLRHAIPVQPKSLIVTGLAIH